MSSTLTPEHARRGYFYAAMVVVLWAGFILVSRMGGKSALTPYDIIALRYGTAGLVMFPLWLYHRTPLWEWRKIVLTCVGALGFTLLAFNGFRHAPASHAGILLQGFLPFAVAVMAYAITGERPGRHRVAGLVLIGGGVGAMATESFAASGLTLAGDALLVGASCCWALYTVLLRRWHMPPMEAAIAITLLATFFYLPVYALVLPKHLAGTPWQEWLLYAGYQGIFVAVVQMIFYIRSVALLGATRLAVVTSCTPVIASLAAVPLLGEPITVANGVGLALVCLGAWVANR